MGLLSPIKPNVLRETISNVLVQKKQQARVVSVCADEDSEALIMKTATTQNPFDSSCASTLLKENLVVNDVALLVGTEKNISNSERRDSSATHSTIDSSSSSSSSLVEDEVATTKKKTTVTTMATIETASRGRVKKLCAKRTSILLMFKQLEQGAEGRRAKRAAKKAAKKQERKNKNGKNNKDQNKKKGGGGDKKKNPSNNNVGVRVSSRATKGKRKRREGEVVVVEADSKKSKVVQENDNNPAVATTTGRASRPINFAAISGLVLPPALSVATEEEEEVSCGLAMDDDDYDSTPVSSPQVLKPKAEKSDQTTVPRYSMVLGTEHDLPKMYAGGRIAVFWPLGNVFYPATVLDAIEEDSNFFYICYDDGETEWIDLTKHIFQVPKEVKEEADDDDESATSAVPPPNTAAACAAKAPKSKSKKQGTKTTTAAAAAPQTKPIAAAATKKTTSSSNTSEPSKKTVKKPSSSSTSSYTSSDNSSSKTDATADSPSSNATTTTLTSNQRNKLIREGVKRHGTNNWEAIAATIPGYSAVECFRRWEKFLNPGLSRAPFSAQECRLLLEWQSQNGNQWIQLVEQLHVKRSTCYISDVWNKKIRQVILEQMESLGYKQEDVEGEGRRINYHGHFEQVLERVVEAMTSATNYQRKSK